VQPDSAAPASDDDCPAEEMIASRCLRSAQHIRAGLPLHTKDESRHIYAEHCNGNYDRHNHRPHFFADAMRK
jgi:hypothetical protein